MTLLEALLLTLAGLFTGVVNVVAGGGSLLTVPLLIGMGVPATVANATTRLAIVSQNVAAAEAFRRRGLYRDPRDLHALALLLAAGLPGAALGAWCGALLNRASWGDAVFERMLAVVMVVLALHTLRSHRGRGGGPRVRPDGFRRGRLTAAAIAIGFYGGLIQAGVGFVLIALLLSATPWSIGKVNAAKVLIVGAANALALAVFAATMEVAWAHGLVLAVGQTIGGFGGGAVHAVVSERAVLRAYVVLLLIFAGLLAF